MSALRETAPAKLNLALHVRGRLPHGRHRIETIFAFCEDGDELTAEPANELSLAVSGPFAGDLGDDNLVLAAARALQQAAGMNTGAALTLDKRLPVASGIGGGSADAAATLRLLTQLWGIDPTLAAEVAPRLGADVPACLVSKPMRGDGAGEQLTAIDIFGAEGTPLLLVNPRVPLPTAAVFARWDGIDRGPLGTWRDGRNDLEAPATALVPQIAEVLDWLSARRGAAFVRMSGSGATCFALFDDSAARDAAAAAAPAEWWHLPTRLR